MNLKEESLDLLFTYLDFPENAHLKHPGAAKQTCYHSWKQYNGFTESYQYCEHCDEKLK